MRWATCRGSRNSRAQACSTGGCRPASRCRCRRMIRRYAMTRIRWNPAISISASRRRRSAPARSERVPARGRRADPARAKDDRFALTRRNAAELHGSAACGPRWRRCARACAGANSLFLPRPEPSFWSKPRDETGVRSRRRGGVAHGFDEHLALDSGSRRGSAAVRRPRQDFGADGRFRQGYQVVQERADGGRKSRDRARQDRPEDDRPPASARSNGDRHRDAQGGLNGRAPRRQPCRAWIGGAPAHCAPLGVEASMFEIGWSELLLIAVVALIAIGPKELPTVLRTLGQWMSKLRRMASEFQSQFQEAMREAEMADLKKQVDEMTSQAQSYANFDPVSEVRRELESTQQQIESAMVNPTAAATQSPSVAAEPDTSLATDAAPPSPAVAASTDGAAPSPAAAPEPADADAAKPDGKSA